MTHAEQILKAVAALIRDQGKETFSREDVRSYLNIDPEQWNLSYNPTFQGMRIDQPGGAPQGKYKNVFRRIEHGKYQLTSEGYELVKALRQ